MHFKGTAINITLDIELYAVQFWKYSLVNRFWYRK